MAETGRARIALINDDTTFLDLMRDLLEASEGYDVLICKEGDNAYLFVKEQRPDLVVLDIRMEGEETLLDRTIAPGYGKLGFHSGICSTDVSRHASRCRYASAIANNVATTSAPITMLIHFSMPSPTQWSGRTSPEH